MRLTSGEQFRPLGTVHTYLVIWVNLIISMNISIKVDAGSQGRYTRTRLLTKYIQIQSGLYKERKGGIHHKQRNDHNIHVL